MVAVYAGYECKRCGKEFVLLIDDIQNNEKSNRYLTCPYCGSKRIEKEKISDNVRECMRSRSYRRIKGAIREMK